MSFVKYITNAYDKKDDLSRMINYCMNDVNCYGEITQEVISATYNLNPLSKERLMEDFYKLKEITNQNWGRQFEHIVVSVFRKEMSQNGKIISANLVMDTVCQWFLKHGHQSVAFVHIKKSGNIHIHIIINNINFRTGNRLTNIFSVLNELTNLLRYQYSYLYWENPKKGNK